MNWFDISLFKFFNGFAGLSLVLDQTIIFFADYLAYILIAFFVVLIFKKSTLIEKLKLGLTGVVSAILSLLIIVPGIRFLYNHPRPFLEILGAQKLFNESGYSFPSAHATFFFALSIIVYKENKTSGIVFLILSSIMGMARVAAGVHYPFDILGGAIMGIIIGLASIETIKNLLRKKEQTFKN